MFAYSPFFKPIFWVIMGLIYTMTALGAPIWAEDLGLQMSWWKWILAALWYILLNFSFAGTRFPGMVRRHLTKQQTRPFSQNISKECAWKAIHQ